MPKAGQTRFNYALARLYKNGLLGLKEVMNRKKGFSTANFCAVSGAIVLFGSEVLAAAVAAAWAFAGIFNLGTIGFYALAIIFVGGALYATFAFARQAFRTEPVTF
jgi:hypothetical protein